MSSVARSPHRRTLAAILSPAPLLIAACCAAGGALAAREGGIVGAALAASIAACVSVLRRAAGPVVIALPAAFGALSIPEPAPIWPTGGPVHLAGTVVGRFSRDTAGGNLRFEVAPVGGGPRVFCTAPLRGALEPERLLPGDRVSGKAFLRDPGARRDPTRPPLVEVELGALRVHSGAPTPRRLATHARLAFENALRRALPDEAGRVAAHLVLGSGPRLPDDLVDAHRATGLAHLLAVSGAHATILAWMLAAGFAIARGRDPWQARAFRRGCAVFLLSYGAVTGFEPPVLRALVAWTVLALAAAHGRRAGITSALAAPALITALVTPRDLFSVSFCLSYAAVIGLGAAGAFGHVEGLGGRVAQALRASLWALVATAPLTLLYFGQVAPWTVVGTPLLAPLVAVMLALGTITAVLGVVSPVLAAIPAVPLAFLGDGYVAAVRTLAELPLAPIHAPFAPAPIVLVAFALLGAALLVLRTDRRGLFAACLVACLPHFVGPIGRVPPALTLCDVGHGQAAVAHLPGGQTVVVDCGTLLDPARAAIAVERALAPRRYVDLLILSHGDADHAGGVPRLARRIPITRALLPDSLRRTPLARMLASRGVELAFVAAGASATPIHGVHVYAPRVRPDASSNDRGLWTRLDGPGASALLPGDAQAEGIRAALRDRALTQQVDVLVLPHHGRGRTVDLDRLLDAVQPRVCIASTGASGDAPLARVADARGLPVMITATQGAVRVRLEPPGIVEADRPTSIAPAGSAHRRR